jgi:hypothetical protein
MAESAHGEAPPSRCKSRARPRPSERILSPGWSPGLSQGSLTRPRAHGVPEDDGLLPPGPLVPRGQAAVQARATEGDGVAAAEAEAGAAMQRPKRKAAAGAAAATAAALPHGRGACSSKRAKEPSRMRAEAAAPAADSGVAAGESTAGDGAPARSARQAEPSRAPEPPKGRPRGVGPLEHHRRASACLSALESAARAVGALDSATLAREPELAEEAAAVAAEVQEMLEPGTGRGGKLGLREVVARGRQLEAATEQLRAEPGPARTARAKLQKKVTMLQTQVSALHRDAAAVVQRTDAVGTRLAELLRRHNLARQIVREEARRAAAFASLPGMSAASAQIADDAAAAFELAERTHAIVGCSVCSQVRLQQAIAPDVHPSSSGDRTQPWESSYMPLGQKFLSAITPRAASSKTSLSRRRSSHACSSWRPKGSTTLRGRLPGRRGGVRSRRSSMTTCSVTCSATRSPSSLRNGSL